MIGWLQKVPAGISGAALAVATVFLAWVNFFPPKYIVKLAPAEISKAEGLLYTVEIPSPTSSLNLLFNYFADSSSAPAASTARVLENGKGLGPAHSSHEDIRALGSGRYSHWGNLLYFSASDGSDPRTNGRRYTFESQLKPRLLLVGAIGVLFGGALLAFSASMAARTRFNIIRTALVVGMLASTLAVIWIGLEAVPVKASQTFSASEIVYDSGYRYRVAVRATPPIPLLSISSDAHGSVSNLILFEDEEQIGRPHSLHAEIAALGEGRYSHWDADLQFSTSDNTDPRTNGRQYSYEVRFTPPTWVRLFGVAALIVALGAFARIPRSPLAPLSRALFGDGAVPAMPRFTGPLLVVGGSVAGILVYVWMLSQTVPGGGLGAVFQVSDASVYWGCANDWIDDGRTGAWCHRRPLYSMFLASVSAVSGRNLEIALFVQAGIIGACLTIFVREMSRWLGLVPALIVGIGVVQYAWIYTFGQTMSEVLGLSLGLLGAAALLRAAVERSYSHALGALFIFTLALMVRPGALFALPMLVVWAALLPGRELKPFIIRLFFAMVPIALAFLVNNSAVAVAGGDPAASNSNLAWTAYGLSVGRDWISLLTDHPELAAETKSNIDKIYELTLQNITFDPSVFLSRLHYNFELYLTSPWYQAILRNSSLGTALIVGGLVSAGVMMFRSPRAGAVFCVAAGELAASFFLTGDANQRVWAATGAFGHVTASILPLAVLARWLTSADRLGLQFDNKISSVMVSNPRGRGRTLVAVLSVVALLMALPATPLLQIWRHPDAATLVDCPAGLRSVALDVGTSSRIAITSTDAPPSSFPRRVSMSDVERNFVAGSWMNDSFRKLADLQLILSTPLQSGVGAQTALYAPVSMSIPLSGRLDACVDDSKSIVVADRTHALIVSIWRQTPGIE